MTDTVTFLQLQGLDLQYEEVYLGHFFATFSLLIGIPGKPDWFGQLSSPKKTIRNSIRFSNPLVSLTSPHLSRLSQPFLPFLFLDLLYYRHSQPHPL